MPRRTRFSTGGYVFHVLNRAVGRQTIFAKDGDYSAFLNVLEETRRQFSLRILAYCALRTSLARGSPFGNNEWSLKTAAQLGLEKTLNPRGRPSKG